MAQCIKLLDLAYLLEFSFTLFHFRIKLQTRFFYFKFETISYSRESSSEAECYVMAKLEFYALKHGRVDIVTQKFAYLMSLMKSNNQLDHRMSEQIVFGSVSSTILLQTFFFSSQ